MPKLLSFSAGGRACGITAVFAAVLACAQVRASGAAQPPEVDDAFWKHWGDGKAELAGYALSFSRYGQSRQGVAVTIFVTETLSRSLRVKADPGKHAADDVLPVMKLNLVRDFQTGVYDYNMMTSSFVTLAPSEGLPKGSPSKVSMSSQEWCGHVFHQLLFDRNTVAEQMHSYFDGEGDKAQTLSFPEGGRAGWRLALAVGAGTGGSGADAGREA